MQKLCSFVEERFEWNVEEEVREEEQRLDAEEEDEYRPVVVEL